MNKMLHFIMTTYYNFHVKLLTSLNLVKKHFFQEF